MNKNQTIEYDPNIISKVKKMIEEGLEKLKSYVKLKNDKKIQNFNFYIELKEQFTTISIKLNELKFCTEYNYFISIKDYILYIVYQNSIDSTFGHCNFTLELFDFFVELFKTGLKFYNTTIEASSDEFKTLQKNFKERYWDYRCTFYTDIYQPSGDFTEEEMYKIHEHIRE